MHMYNTGLTLVLVSALFVPSSLMSLSIGSGKCIYYNSLKGYDCHDSNLHTIPQDLKTSIEVLDVSYNRIRDLSKDMFARYSYLKTLYLNENMIMTIDADTFENLPNLETLDLSVNALVEIPSTILHLPTLKNLMLAKNTRLDILQFFSNAGEITAPLQKLDLSYNPLLNQLPNFGTMMYLMHLNITGTHLTNVSKSHFVGLCNLKMFINDNLTMEFATACDCAKIDHWFALKKVKSIPEFSPRCEFAIDTTVAECKKQDIEPNADELATHEKCITDFHVRETLRSASQICLIVFASIGGILLFIGICYVYYRLQRFSDDDENKNVKIDPKTKSQLLIKDVNS